MANTKISALTAGAPAVATDLIPIDRAGANYSLRVSDVLTAPTTGSAKASGFFPATSPYVSYFEEFFGQGAFVTSSVGSPAGNTFAPSSAAPTVAHIGVWALNGGTTSATGMAAYLNYLISTSIAGAVPWYLETEIILSTLTTAGYFFGFFNTVGFGPAQAFGLKFDAASGVSATNWLISQFGSGSPGTDTDSGVAAASGTWTKLALSSDGTNLAMLINGVSVFSTPLSNLATNLIRCGYIAYGEASTINPTLSVDYLMFQKAVVR